MIVYVENVGLVGCRTSVNAEGKEVTYGSIYTRNGELLPFSANCPLSDDLTCGFSGNFDISWGTGKNGKWVSCRYVD